MGTAEQSGSTNTHDELDYTLNAINKSDFKSKIPKATFVLIRCGIRIMEMFNVGSYNKSEWENKVKSDKKILNIVGSIPKKEIAYKAFQKLKTNNKFDFIYVNCPKGQGNLANDIYETENIWIIL